MSAFPRIVAVEGNIGAGKSTLLTDLERVLADTGRTDIVVLREPVHEWENTKDADGKNILELFYADQAQNAFAFQILVITTFVAEIHRVIREHPACRVIVCERSIASSKHVFSKMLFDAVKITHIQYNVYCRAFAELDIPPDRLVFLQCGQCKARISARGRTGEDQITDEYLSDVDKYYCEWIRSLTIPVIMLDAMSLQSTLVASTIKFIND